MEFSTKFRMAPVCNYVQTLRTSSVRADTASVMNTANACATATAVPLSHVILVEDRAGRGLEELLELEGFRVTLALDGPTGIKAAEQGAVDAVVLDVMLPGMSGFDVCRALRSSAPTSQVPIVMLTGLCDTPSKLQGFDFGADDYLVKPIPARELAARLRKLIGSRAEAADTVHRQRLQAISEIATAVSHEVNNPLAAALGTLDLVMLGQSLSVEVRHDLAQCRTHLWRIASILAQLTNVRDRTTEYVGPDRMIELTTDSRD
jgi:DNA-binding response OmpR family regulator